MVRIIMSWSILGVIIPLSSSSVLKHDSQLKVPSQLFRILHGPGDDNPDWLISFGGWRFVETSRWIVDLTTTSHISWLFCWSYHTVIICSMFSPDLGSTGKMAQMNAEEPQKKWLLNVCGMASCEWFKLRLLPEKCPFYEHWVWSLSVNFENQTLTTYYPPVSSSMASSC